MKKFLIFSLITIFALAQFGALAKPAKQGLRSVTMSDGSTINVRLVGDEFFHQYFTEDGIPLVEEDGIFYYCDYDSDGNRIVSDIKATAAAKRSAEANAFISKINRSTLGDRINRFAKQSPRRLSMAKRRADAQRKAAAANLTAPPYEKGYGLFPDAKFPAYGNQKAIVILVEYTDVKFNTDYDAHDYFSRMLNEEGFNDLGATGSAAQYFRENSQGAFTPEFDVYGPIQLAHNQAYYGGNDRWGDDKNPGAMVKEACDALDQTVNFKDYDRNNDGIVDNIFIFYAGKGEASGGDANTVWPHSWDMASAGFPNLYYDDVRVDTYGCSNEWEGKRPDGVGTFVHEFSHVMGLPDLYDTNYTMPYNTGSWSALDYGPYNNDGMTPPNYGAFERYALGWAEPLEMDRELNVALPPIDQNIFGIVRSSKPTEFFLFENRQQTGWDEYIPHHGMLVWHIDYNNYAWTYNEVNNTSSHQYVDIVEADGKQSSLNVDGDPFPGSTNKTSFTALTNPAMKTWANVGLNYPVTDINEADGIIAFKVLGGVAEDLKALVAHEASDVTAESFTISWSEPAEGNNVYLNVYTRQDGSDPVYLDGYNNRNIGHVTSFTVTGAEPTTTYYYTVAQASRWNTSSLSEEKKVTTPRRSIDYYDAQAVRPTDITYNSFTANWLPLDEATGYLLTVYTKTPGDPFYVENGFDNGLQDLGEWTVSPNVTTYAMTAYSGKAAPSLRIPTGSSLTTPRYADYISELSFWHRGNSTDPSDVIEIYAQTIEGNVKIAAVPVSSQTSGATTTLSKEIPDATTQLQIMFVRNGGKGYLALDDVRVAHGQDSEPIYLDGYSSLKVGNVLSYKVEGLNPATDYFYTVSATDGELFSKPSNEIKATTANDPNGVSDPATNAIDIKVDGLTLTANTSGEIVVANISGQIIARGRGNVELPGPGFYILTIPSEGLTSKLIIQ